MYFYRGIFLKYYSVFNRFFYSDSETQLIVEAYIYEIFLNAITS